MGKQRTSQRHSTVHKRPVRVEVSAEIHVQATAERQSQSAEDARPPTCDVDEKAF